MERITVNMSPTAMLETCHASQFDVGVQKRFDLVDGSSAYTLTGAETITLKIRTPDGTLVESNVPNTSDSYVIWTSKEGELDAFGICLCSIHVTNGSDELGSGNFIMEVETDPYDGAGVHVVTVGPADICTFETTLPEPLQSVLVNVVATGGNGTPDNPNPINGFTEANITRCGVNLWDEDWERGTISTSTGENLPSTTQIRSVNYIPAKPSTTYYNKGYPITVYRYDINKNFLGYSTVQVGTFTLDANTYYIRFWRTSTTYNNDISILYPSNTTPEYHPYTGNTYTIAFGQTVYGGVLDVTRGKLHVTHVIAVFDGTEVYSNYFPTIVCEKIFTKGSGTPVDMVCSHAPTVAIPNQWFGYANANNEKFEFRKVGDNWGCSDIDAFKAFITSQYSNGTPVTIKYPLNTPFDIDLTPEVISAVVGTNNVFADCGQTEVKYLKAGE